MILAYIKVSDENREKEQSFLTEYFMVGNRIRDLQNINAAGCLDVFTCSGCVDKYWAGGENPQYVGY